METIVEPGGAAGGHDRGGQRHERHKTRAARRTTRRFLGWTLRIAAGLLLVLTMPIAVLAFPHPFYPHGQTFGEFVVRSDRPIPDGFEAVIAEARARVSEMEHTRPGEGCRVFISHDFKFGVVAFLTRRNSDSMAIGLSVFGNVYINGPKVAHVAAHNPGGIRHSRFEGNIAEVIAHEIAHFTVVDRVGYRAALAMPVWKSEGYAEYQANLATTRADSSYVLTDRIAFLQDDLFWGNGESVARWLFATHLLVEFLYEVRGIRFDDLIDDTVTEARACRDMLAWYANQVGEER